MKGASSPPGLRLDQSRRLRSTPGRRVIIGLVNNMPDSALRATERQFLRLVRVPGELEVDVRLFYLPEIQRGQAAREHLLTRYAPAEELRHAKLDALIVTGCEPKQPNLSDEPYWSSLAALVDWAKRNTISTIWSCLAAHAAVLQLDGIERRPRSTKLSGVYEFPAASSHPLLSGAGPSVHVPHSRLNGLRASDLVAHGYELLTYSDEIGVDAFVKACPSLFIFLQGHPEYNRDSLYREYRRDVGRFLAGQTERYPPLPQGYFGRKATLALTAFAKEARAKPRPELLAQFPRVHVRPHREIDWRISAAQFYANWLNYVAETKGRRAGHAERIAS